MERVVIGRELVFMAGTADRRRLHAECGFGGLQDRMRSVTVGADRRLQVTFGDALAMGAALELIVDLGVACAAGLRDIRLECGAARILVAQDAVRSVTALAIGGDQQAFFAQRKPVN